MNLVMAFIGCLFDSFSISLLSLKQQQNLMKILFSCIHFPVWPYPPKIMKKTVLYTGKLYGLTGMKVLSCFFPFNLIVCHSESDDVATSASIYEA